MAFDWLGFLHLHGIRYVAAGKNVAKGHVALRCPFCGPADPSQHMGIELATGAWGCWRNEAHRGKRPQRLMVELAGITWAEAHAMVEADQPLELMSLADLAKRAKEIGAKENVATFLQPVECPREFKTIHTGELSVAKFWAYLADRGFPADDIPAVCKRYGLRCALTGEFSNRIIVPFKKGRTWYGWSGRSLYPAADLRYKSFPANHAVKQILFNHNAMAKGGRALVVVEGPFDAIKFDFYARAFAIRAVSILGTYCSDEQAAILLAHAPARFEQVFILLDPTAFGQSLQLQSKLSKLRPHILRVPVRAKDPGAMTPISVRGFCKGVILPRLDR